MKSSGVALDAHPLHQSSDALAELRAVCGDDATGHQREDERLAAGVGAGLEDSRPPLPTLLQRRERRVVLVRVAGGEPRRARLGGSADDHRRPRLLQRLRQRVERLQPIVAPVVADIALRPLPDDELELLLEPLQSLRQLRKRKAVGRVLARVPARSDSELDAATGDVVGGDDRLRE